MFRRVQPYLGGGVVGGRRPGEDDPGRYQGQEGPVQLHGRRHLSGTDRRTLHHHEPRVRRSNGTARESQGFVQVSTTSGEPCQSIIYLVLAFPTIQFVAGLISE